MKDLGNGRTEFTIRRETSGDPKPGAPFPFIRRGRLDVFGDDGSIMRGQIEPIKDERGTLVYRFELHKAHAKASSFTIVEFVDNQQVGGGKVFSYRLIDFIDPKHRWKEIVSRINVHKIDARDFGFTAGDK